MPGDNKWLKLTADRPLSPMEEIFLDRLAEDLMRKVENDPAMLEALARLTNGVIRGD